MISKTFDTINPLSFVSVVDYCYIFNLKIGDKSFLEQIKDRLGIREKGRKVHGNEEEYHLCEGQTDYGGWKDLDNENTFDWNLAN